MRIAIPDLELLATLCLCGLSSANTDGENNDYRMNADGENNDCRLYSVA